MILLDKKKFAFILVLFFIFNFNNAHASHAMGGEITWTCLPGGQYVFKMKYYRDCNGIASVANVTLTTSVPGVTIINLPLIAQNDISPDGFLSNGVTPCLNCANASSSNSGLVEENVYQSSPVILPGVPPATGWSFTYSDCCRSNVVTNIATSSSYGVRFVSMMYPFSGTAMSPCYDSSPYFAEPPSAAICTGYPFTYSTGVMDPDNDSLVYSWYTPFSDNGLPITWAPGYSVNSQLPSSVQNPQNVPATLDPNSGEMHFTSFTGGYFVVGVKVASYRCGIKVAEVFREVYMLLNNNCPVIASGIPNNPPTWTAPFFDPVSGLQTSYSDTVTAGDTVNFSILALDYDFFTNNAAQTMTITANGNQFGANFSDPASGCVTPPCATLFPPPPVISITTGGVSFNWVTSCDHATGTDSLCSSLMKTHYFVFKAADNYCPANASKTVTVAVTVRSQALDITASGPATICAGDTVILTASGALSYTWNTGETTNSIIVTQPGTYTVTGTFNPGTCYADSSVSFTINTGILPVSITVPQDTLCLFDPAMPLTATPPGGVWSGPGVSISGNTFNPTIAGVGSHKIFYNVSDSLGCTGVDTISLVVTVCTGLDEQVSGDGLRLYPNPAWDMTKLVITGKQNQDLTIELFNIYGQHVMDIFNGKPEHDSYEISVNTASLPGGIYIIKTKGKVMSNLILLKN